MARSIVGLFDSRTAARAAVEDLRNAGFPREKVSVILSNAGANERGAATDATVDAEEGASFGAAGGALMGGFAGLLVGLGALVIPGIGPVIAGGTWATALASTAVGAGLGAATGGLIGALVGVGIPEEEAHVYAESIRRGSTLVSVEAATEAEVSQAHRILSAHNVVDIEQRGRTLRESGWTRFDQQAPPYAGPWYDQPIEDEGSIERGASKAGNAVERAVNADLDRDGDVGRRDPRNNV